MNDLNFNNGDYYQNEVPQSGLAAARMLAHITYLSEEGMHRKFGRKLQDKCKPNFGFDVEFEVESYLNYQGKAFVERFDANSYLYITRAMDYYDAAEIWGEGDLLKACSRIKADVLVAAFSSDWLYTSAQSKELALSISKSGKPVTFTEIKSPYGHDAFLVETDHVGRLLCGYLSTGRKN
jgi:homoserine O-acetyltransferase